MRWQKTLRLAIAAFVVVFAAILGLSFRRGGAKHTEAPPAPKKLSTDVLSEGGAGHADTFEQGKVVRSIAFGHNVAYANGRQKLSLGVTAVIPDKNGRRIEIRSQDADVMVPPGKQISSGEFTGGVTLTTSDGITVKSATASYDDTTQLTTIPGPVTFSKGKMTGSGNGATYDQTRGVLWLLADAKVDVAPDGKGSPAMHVTSAQAGMARLEHYMKFIGQPHMEGEGHVIDADDTTVFLTPDDERMTRMELRGNSRITSKPGAAGPQLMRAKDIDLTYAEDGRTLQSAHLVDGATVRLAGEKGKAGKQIAGKGIDLALGPDGSTVTNLTAAENVVVNLPADGDIPARRITSAVLLAMGAPSTPDQPGGIRSATFDGGVEFRETRPAKGKVAAVDRTARSDKLELLTKPGFGDLERADFHTNVHFTDGPQTTADAPTAIYAITQDRLDLSPGPGDTGKGPHVTDGRISVEAKNIQMGLSSQRVKADTRVRSVMIQQQGKSGDDAVKVPSMLKADRPVNVQSNRLDYDSGASLATYEGNARLWQDGDDGGTILGDKIIVDDKTGNLRAITNVTTSTVMRQAGQNAKPKPAQKPEATVTKATEMLYEDAKHRATYTGSVHMNGPDGDVTSDKLELFFTEQGGDLERAEADGNVVSKQEARRAFGKHLTYDAKTDTYTMTGAPAMVYDDTPPNCKLTKAPAVTFQQASNVGSATGNNTVGQRSEAVACGTGPGSD